jgi:hypothetical protein
VTIEVTEETDGSLTISWDENDPKERLLNQFTEQDFIEVIIQRINQVEQERITDS